MQDATGAVGPQHDGGEASDPVPPASFEPSRPVASFAYCVRGVLLTPRAFFRGLPEREGAMRPLLFALAAALLAKGADLALSLPNRPSFAPRGILLHAADALFALFIVAVLAHVVSAVIAPKGGEHAGFGRTARVVCYASATVLFAPIPLVGILAGLYGFWLIAVGIKTAPGKPRGEGGGPR